MAERLVPVEDVIRQLKRELDEAASRVTTLTFTKVELQLAVVSSTETSGGVKFEIPAVAKAGAGGTVTHETGRSIYLTFVPSPAKAFRAKAIEFGLVRELQGVERAVQAARQAQLQLTETAIEFAMTVTAKGETGFEVVVVKAGAAGKSGSGHKLKVHFKPSEKA